MMNKFFCIFFLLFWVKKSFSQIHLPLDELKKENVEQTLHEFNFLKASIDTFDNTENIWFFKKSEDDSIKFVIAKRLDTAITTLAMFIPNDKIYSLYENQIMKSGFIKKIKSGNANMGLVVEFHKDNYFLTVHQSVISSKSSYIHFIL